MTADQLDALADELRDLTISYAGALMRLNRAKDDAIYATTPAEVRRARAVVRDIERGLSESRARLNQINALVAADDAGPGKQEYGDQGAMVLDIRDFRS